MNLRIPALLALAAASATQVCATDYPEHEPNDTFPPGPSLGVFQSGDRITGNISSATDVDWLYIDTAGTGKFGLYRYSFLVQGLPSGGDSLLTIFDTETTLDSYGEPVGTLSYNDDESSSATYSHAYFDLWTQGAQTRWGVKIEGFNSTDIWPYAVQVTWEPVTFIEAGQYTAGAITFDTLQTTGVSDTVLTLFDSAGHFLATNDDADGTTFLSSLTATLADGDYYVAVTSAYTYTPITTWDRSGIGPGNWYDGAYVLAVNGTALTGTLSLGLADWYHVKVQSPTKTIAGTVTLNNFKGVLSTVPITFDVRQTGTTNVLDSHTVNLASDGTYSFTTTQSGTVDIAAKGAEWLRALLTVDLNGATNSVNYTLTPGDVNNDNVVNMLDLGLVLSNFTQSGSGITGDCDGDALVGFTDLGIVLTYFGQTGAP
jgi:hypothetical protein